MTRPSFDEIWIPRIGKEAADQLRHNSRITMITIFPLLPLAIAGSFAFGSGSSRGIAVGLLTVVMAGIGMIIWLRSRMNFTAAVSRWFGVKLWWGELPTLRSSGQFDAWCEKRNLSHPHGETPNST